MNGLFISFIALVELLNYISDAHIANTHIYVNVAG